MESKTWRHTRIGTFCSVGCADAGAVPLGALAFVLSAAGSLFILTIAGARGAGFSALLLIIGIPALYCSSLGMLHRRSVPKDSRANDVPLDTALLATVSTSVVCPRCDAELDLRSIGKDRVYACGYCGATGTISVIDKSKQRGV